MGLMRVLAAFQKSPLVAEYSRESSDLQAWVEEILTITVEHVVSHFVTYALKSTWPDSSQTPSGMVRNYINEPDMFEESCGTAILAAAA